MFTVATINVAGLRGATITGKGPKMGHGLQEWWNEDRDQPLDVIALQETKVNEEQVSEPLKVLGVDSSDFYFQEDRFRKGHAGVALWVNPKTVSVEDLRMPLENQTDSERFSFSGRWLEADLSNGVTVVSSYFHHADSPTTVSRDGVQIDRAKSEHSMESKYQFMDVVFARIRELLRTKSHVIVMGDINIAHHEIDLKNAKGNKTKAGFLPEERVWLDLLLSESDLDTIKNTYAYNSDLDYRPPKVSQFDQGFIGMHDVAREQWGPDTARYTWWTNMGRAFDNDAGWRIDYQFTDSELATLIRDARVDKQSSFLSRYSDHAPLVVSYDL